VGEEGAQAMSARSMVRVIPAIAVVAILGCSVDETVDPRNGVPPAPDAGPPPMMDAGQDAMPPPEMDAGPPKRTIEQRNPFGDVAETQNLLWDGDFEWSSPFSDEYGWLPGPPLDYMPFTGIRIGAACHSGIKCAAVKKKHVITAIGVASTGHKLEASFWAHVKGGPCDAVKGKIIADQSGVEPDAPVAAESMDPDASGWCHYRSVIDARSHKPYLNISNQTSDEIVIDDAVLKQAGAMEALSVPHLPPTWEDAQEIAAVRALLFSRRGPHDAPPNEAKRAYEAWRKR
jgi:hypothetical protein